MKMQECNVLGASWVTPIGVDHDSICKVLSSVYDNPVLSGDESFLSVPPDFLLESGSMPRLRRSSSISHFSVSAAISALRAAGVSKEDFLAANPALVFAASDGGVCYTKKFFEGVDREGVSAGSPLLFPETVYNAPASHIAAALGIEGNALTMVGDATVGISACYSASALLEIGECGMVLVVAAQEYDPVAAAGYSAWNLRSSKHQREGRHSRMRFSEGAAAVLLSNIGNSRRISMLPIQGAPTLKESTVLLAEQLRYFSCDRLPAAVVHSAAGAWPSRFELQMLKRIFPSTELYAPKAILGESLAPSSLWQLILALDLASGNRANAPVLVSVLGYQGGAAAVRVDV